MLALYDYQLLNHSLILSALLFSVGVVGFAASRSLPVMVVSAGIMLQAVMLALTSFGTFHGAWSGYAFAMLSLMTMIAIGVVAAAVIWVLLRMEGSLDVARLRQLGEEADVPQAVPQRVIGRNGIDAANLVATRGSEGSDD